METEFSGTSTSFKGFFWSAIERFSVQAVQFLFQIILARLLSPGDYGLIAILAIFMAIAQTFIDAGFSNALIRKSDRNELDYCTVFYTNIGLSIVAYAVLFLLSPIIAAFYRIPRLTSIARVYMLSIPVLASAAIQRTQYTIKVNFREQALATLSGTLVGGIVGVILAVLKYGPWALVFSALATHMVTAAVFWMRSSWRPKLQFSFASFRSMFAFGSRLLFSGLLNTLYINLYQLAIGKKFSSVDLGYYSRADQFAQFPSSNISGILQRVTYPILCSLSRDEIRLMEAYRKYLKLSAMIVFPLMIGLAAVSESFITLLLGSKWLFSARILRILCFAFMWYPIHAMNLNLLLVKGRSDLFFRLEIIKKVIGISILAITLNFNILVMAAGSIISSLIALFINTYYSERLAGYGLLQQFNDIAPFLIVSLMACLPAYLLAKFMQPNLLVFFLSIALSAVLYAAIIEKMKIQEFAAVKTMMKEYLKK
ncbi:MAG: lipopolysaccharide biosynthesis protein [Rectinemataceae bacterium]